MIKIEQLSKNYGSLKVLKNINLLFEKGKIYGIVGENGAGKTTLFKCISGLEKFEGKIVTNPSSLKNYLGLLLTEPYFLSKITGKEYIQLHLNARNKKVKDIEERNIFDLPLNKYASKYSTGMKKKLALTAILLQDNDYFILDEPFNGVDIQSNIIITEIIHRLKDLGKTIILSSHIFSTLSETCDEIYVLKNGEFTQKIKQPDFSKLEETMKISLVENVVDRLALK